jgi:hypothetical protein
VRRDTLSGLVIVLGVLLMAPTVGDTGGCGRTATELESDRYANARKLQDCRRCEECGIETARCQRACDPQALPDIVLPPTCRPLFHDGEVCLRALGAASCHAYARYVDDDAPASPSECEFCRVPQAEPPPAFGDSGVGVAGTP